MAVCTDAGKWLHTLPSYPGLHEPQGFTWKNANKQGSPVCCHHSEWYSAGQCCWVPNFALAQLRREGSTHRRGHDWHAHGPGRAGWSNQYLSQMVSHYKPCFLAPYSKLCHNWLCHRMDAYPHTSVYQNFPCKPHAVTTLFKICEKFSTNWLRL